MSVRCILLTVVLLACSALALAAKAPGSGLSRRIEISVTKTGFEPKSVRVKRHEKVTFVFTRKTEDTCVKDVNVYLENDKTIKRHLPLHKAVEIEAQFAKTGELGYACVMHMYGGAIFID